MLCREDFDSYISEAYGIRADFPFIQYPETAVYRHTSNKKWFAAVMTLHKSKFGLKEEGLVDVVNLKCDPLMIGSLHKDKGIYPAYHMNKSLWVSVFLDGSVEKEKIKWLTDISYELTAVKAKKKEK